MVEKVKGTMAGVSVSVLDGVLSSPSVSSDPVSPHRSRGDATGSQQMPQESGSKALGAGATDSMGRPAAANAARERSRVQTLRHAFLELQRTLPSVPPDTKLSKLDVLILATTYIAHLTRSLQEEASPEGGEKADSQLTPGSSSLLQGALQGDGYLHPVKVFPRNWRFAFCCNCVSQFQLVAYRSHFSYTWKPEKWPMRSRLYTGASGQFLNNSPHSDNSNQGKSPTPSRF